MRRGIKLPEDAHTIDIDPFRTSLGYLCTRLHATPPDCLVVASTGFHIKSAHSHGCFTGYLNTACYSGSSGVVAESKSSSSLKMKTGGKTNKGGGSIMVSLSRFLGVDSATSDSDDLSLPPDDGECATKQLASLYETIELLEMFNGVAYSVARN